MSCNDIPSLLDLQKAKLNADDFGRLMGTGEGDSTNEVTGQVRPTYNKVINDMRGDFNQHISDQESEFNQHISGMAFARVGTFKSGATLDDLREVLLWDISDGGDGHEYGWTGTFPKEVLPNSTPSSTGGFGSGAWVDRTDLTLRSDLASVNGAGLVGTKSNTTVEKVLASDTTLPDVGIFEAAGDNSAAITALASNSNLVMPVHGELRTINSASFSGIEHLVATKVLSAGVVRIPGIYPELLGGKYSVAYNGGKQLSALNTALTDPKFQDFGITFIGDSITWGVGASGAITTGPSRDGTLSDYRNNAGSCSYVNEMRRWIKHTLGEGTTEAISNYAYSVGSGGESISTFSKSEYLFPKGSEYSFAKTGTVSDITYESTTGPLLNCRRVITVALGGTGSLSFTMTGTAFTLVFGGLDDGAMYELLVNNVSQGIFSSRVGDGGIVLANNQRRKHSFDYVRNGTITIKVIQYGSETGTNKLSIEGLYFERTITVSNQGISGASTGTYLVYNFPTSVSAGVLKKLSEQTNWNEVSTGSGSTSQLVRYSPSSTTGEQRIYGFLSNSSWDITFTIPTGNDRVMIGYSSLQNTGAVDVYADNVLITRIHTADWYTGNTTGGGKAVEVTIPTTATSIKLTAVHEIQAGAGSTCYIYLEGVGYRNSANITYPINNSYNDGVCLTVKDCFAFFQLGTNDRVSNRVRSPDEISANIEKMLGLLPQGCLPILMVAQPAEVLPTHAYDMQRVRSATAKVAARRDIDFIDNYSLFGDCPLKYFTKDNLHPNDIGHALIARNITNAIECAS